MSIEVTTHAGCGEVGYRKTACGPFDTLWDYFHQTVIAKCDYDLLMTFKVLLYLDSCNGDF